MYTVQKIPQIYHTNIALYSKYCCPVHIVYFIETAHGVTMRGFYASYESKCIMKYGMKEYELISWRAWHSACNEFMNNIFDINQRETFSCISCGPRPEALVFDGIAMGLQVQELNKYKEEFCKDQRLESIVELQGSKYKSRMFIKLLSNRKILRKAAHEKVWPLFENAQESDCSDPEQEFYASETSKDPGMNQFWRLLRTIDKTEKPSNGYLLLMKELSSYTSTLAIMQVVKRDLAGQLLKFLKDGQAFWRGTTNIDNHMLLRQQYPILMDIILALCDEQGVIALPVR